MQVINRSDDSDGTCVWYGVCRNITGTQHKLYCSNNDTAQPLSSKAQERLKLHCPHLVHGPGTKTCCDDEQVQSILKLIIYDYLNII